MSECSTYRGHAADCDSEDADGQGQPRNTTYRFGGRAAVSRAPRPSIGRKRRVGDGVGQRVAGEGCWPDRLPGLLGNRTETTKRVAPMASERPTRVTNYRTDRGKLLGAAMRGIEDGSMADVREMGGLWLADTHPLAEVVRHMLHMEAEWGWRYAGWNGHGTAVTVQFVAPMQLRGVPLGEDLEIPGVPE